MNKLVIVGLCALVAGCNMTPQQQQAWSQGMHNASQLNQRAPQHISPQVQCQNAYDSRAPILTYQRNCPMGSRQVF